MKLSIICYWAQVASVWAILKRQTHACSWHRARQCRKLVRQAPGASCLWSMDGNQQPAMLLRLFEQLCALVLQTTCSQVLSTG